MSLNLTNVATETTEDNGPFGPVSNKIKIAPVFPPTELQCRYASDRSIAISWDHQNEASQVTSYSIDCWEYGKQETTFIKRSTTDKKLTLEPLTPDTLYCVQVRVACNDSNGFDVYSKAGPILQIRTLQAERTVHIVRKVSQKCATAGLKIDTYKLPLNKQDRGTAGAPTPDIAHYAFGKPSYPALVGKRRQKTILMVGETGSGKTTLINAMANYVLGIEWSDDFRFKLIDESTGKSQAKSQTELITTYDMYRTKGSRLEYSLTVVDTPGLGDTSGMEKDKKIMDQIQEYFKSPKGVQQLEAVCFVVRASLARLTKTQQYIFDSILSIFGNDIKDNIRLMVTFADGAEPPALAAVKEAGIPLPTDPVTGLPLYHLFNSSIFFSSNRDQASEVNEIYFSMAVESFDHFFADLSNMETKSLAMTRAVLEERKRLEALVDRLQMRTEMKLTRVDELEQIKKILTENQEQIEANRDFEFEALVPKAVDISGTGQFTTNCQKCQLTTCHFPCSQSEDGNKKKCSVMDPNSGRCIICKCPWSDHFNQKYKYEMVKEKIIKTSNDLKEQYQRAGKKERSKEQMRDQIQQEIHQLEEQCMELMNETYPCIKRLDEIALRPHSFSTKEYIDLLIENEKQNNSTGCQQRIATLKRLAQKNDLMVGLILREISSPPEPQPSDVGPIVDIDDISDGPNKKQYHCQIL